MTQRLEMDRLLALGGVLFSVLLLAYFSFYAPRAVYLFMAAALLISCLAWVLSIRRSPLERPLLRSNRFFLFLVLAYLFTFLLALLSLFLRTRLYERPLAFYALVSIMVGLTLLESMCSDRRTRYCIALSQIIVIGLLLDWSEQLLFPSVVGSDPAFHRMFSLKLMDSGHIPAGYGYSYYPLAQTHVAISALLGSLSYKTSLMSSITLAQMVCDVLLIYLLGRILFKNERIGLIGALVLVVSNIYVNFGWWAGPNTYSAIFLLAVCYLILKSESTKKPSISALMFVLVVATNLSHPLTAACMTLAIALLTYGSMYQREKNGRLEQYRSSAPTLLMSSLVLMVFWWWIAPGSLSTALALIESGGFGVFDSGRRLLGYSLNISFPEQIFNVAGFVLFFAVSIFGCFYSISTRRKSAVSFCFAGIVILAIGFVSYLAGAELLNVRWWYFAEILLALEFSVALLVTLGSAQVGKLRVALVVTLTVGISFLMIMSSTAQFDNTTFSKNSNSRLAFTEAEMDAAKYLSVHAAGNISSDFLYSTNPSSSLFANYYGVEYGRIKSLDQALYSKEFARNGTMIVIRGEIVDRPFLLSEGLYRLDYDPVLLMESLGFDKVFDNGWVEASV